MKITKQDIKENIYYFRLIIIYSMILGIVYGIWMYRSDIRLVYDILVGCAFVLVGVVVDLIFINQKRKEREKKENEESAEIAS